MELHAVHRDLSHFGVGRVSVGVGFEREIPASLYQAAFSAA